MENDRKEIEFSEEKGIIHIIKSKHNVPKGVYGEV